MNNKLPILRAYHPDDKVFAEDSKKHNSLKSSRIAPPEREILLPLWHPEMMYQLKEHHKFQIRVYEGFAPDSLNYKGEIEHEKGRPEGDLHRVKHETYWTQNWHWNRRRTIKGRPWGYLHGELECHTMDDRWHHISGTLDMREGNHEVLVEDPTGKIHECVMIVFFDWHCARYYSYTVLKKEVEETEKYLGLRMVEVEVYDEEKTDRENEKISDDRLHYPLSSEIIELRATSKRLL
jgi:hypothetical protein